MVRKLVLGLSILLCSIQINAQEKLSSEVAKMQENARIALDKSDFANSIMLLNQAIRLEPGDVSLRRDLAYTYFLSGKPKAAKDVIDPVLNSDFADEQTFQIAAAVETSLDNYRKAKRILNSGIKKYPYSGILYNSRGNLYSKNKSDKAALASWQKGIEVEPSYAANYYMSAKEYFKNEKPVWALIYSEIFLNLDPLSPRGPEMKKLMIEAYQQLLSPGTTEKLPEFSRQTSSMSTGSFEEAFKASIFQNSSIIRNGINIESLTMLRTRFLLTWENEYVGNYPFTLITYQQNILQQGFFDAYNQWLFGAYLDSQGYSLWVQKYNQLFKDFEKWRSSHLLQPASYDPKP